MRKWILIGCATILFGIVIFIGAFANLKFDIAKLSTLPPFEKQSEVVENTNQTITLKDCNTPINIKKSSDDKIHLDYYVNEKESYNINSQDNIEVSKELNYKWYDYIFNINFQQCDFTISLPENFNGDIDVNTENGKITLDDISANILTLKTSNGDFDVENIKSGSLSAKTNNGYIYVSSSEIKDTAKLTTSNGAVEQNKVNVNDLSVETYNGKIKLYDANVNNNATLVTNNQEINFSNLSVKGDLKLNTANGKITGNILQPMSNFSIISNTSNGHNNLPSNVTMGTQKMDVKTSNGDINIQFES